MSANSNPKGTWNHKPDPIWQLGDTINVLTEWESAGIALGKGCGIALQPMDEAHRWTIVWRVNEWVYFQRFMLSPRSLGRWNLMSSDSLDGPLEKSHWFENHHEAMKWLDYTIAILTLGTGVEQRDI